MASQPESPVRTFVCDELTVRVYADNAALGRAAAVLAADVIREAVAARGVANVVLATGNSQLSTLHALRDTPGVPWPAVNVFHMDEYLNLPPGHRASFPLFLRQHLLDQVPIGAFFPVPGRAADPVLACRAYELLLRSHPVDLCCLGIGENGHLAFNDPPGVDFDDPAWIKPVPLAEASRRQQVGEGHFGSLDEVPTHAITLTVPGLRAARQMLCMVPERRKAEAVRRSLREPVSPECPGSILRKTPHALLLLDQDSASAL